MTHDDIGHNIGFHVNLNAKFDLSCPTAYALLNCRSIIHSKSQKDTPTFSTMIYANSVKAGVEMWGWLHLEVVFAPFHGFPFQRFLFRLYLSTLQNVFSHKILTSLHFETFSEMQFFQSSLTASALTRKRIRSFLQSQVLMYENLMSFSFRSCERRNFWRSQNTCRVVYKRIIHN